MEQRVTYRPFRSGDAEALAEIILDTWAFDARVTSPRQAAHIGYAYLYLCMMEANFA